MTNYQTNFANGFLPLRRGAQKLNIAEQYRARTFEEFSAKIRDALTKFLDGECKNLFLVGGPGTAKTTATYILIMKWLEQHSKQQAVPLAESEFNLELVIGSLIERHGYNIEEAEKIVSELHIERATTTPHVEFVKWNKLLQCASNAQSYSTDGDDSPALAKADLRNYEKCALLVIDDVGIVEANTAARQTGVYDLIDHRCEYALPVVITTNVGKNISQIFPPAILSRLSPKCRVVKFAGADYRQKCAI